MLKLISRLQELIMPTSKKVKTPQQLWERISCVFVNFVEKIFFSLGVFVARRPWWTIGATWLFVLLSCCGLVRFYIEKSPIKLWVPPESDFYKDTNWYIDNFGIIFRLQRILVTADNVLDPEVIMVIHNITNNVNSIEVDYKNETFLQSDLCFKVPVIKFGVTNWKTQSSKTVKNNKTQNFKHSVTKVDYSDPSLWIDSEYYCSLIESFPVKCLQYNIIDIWNDEPNFFTNLTKNDIISNVNRVTVNPTTGHPVDYTKLLGGVQYDVSGDIVSARSVLLTWYMQVNMTVVDLGEVGNLIGTEDWVSVPLAMWEKKFLVYASSLNNTKGLQFFYEAGRSFADTSGDAMFQEMDNLFLGIIVMFIYVLLAISRCNWLEIRLTVASVGLLSVGMAYITTVGWCSILGIPFGPVHSSLPFLLMGLGLDDMFVMNACWKLVTAAHSNQLSLPLKIGYMLKHAGVSIVITSFTDIVALLVGAITILPSLKSFCMYAAIGVFFIFLYSVTFFVAIFTLDVKRVQSKRNSILFCYQHTKDVKLSTEKSVFQKLLLRFYQNIVLTKAGKVMSILFTIVMTCFSIEAILRLEQRFDPKWFIPDDTYYKEFINNYEHFYPEDGNTAMVFLGDMNYNAEFVKLYDMTEKLKNESYINDLNSWVESFHGYVLYNYDRNLRKSNISDVDFKKYLSKFLYSPVGGRFQFSFKFSKPLQCGDIASDILATSMSFSFIRFDGPEQYIPAMNNVKSIVKSTNITSGDSYRSVWSKVFGNWATDEIISVEVERNIELALLCVMLCTIVLITNLQMCLWIFICVLLTIINVLGWMERWGMTVDIVCCIGLELAIGLCVDYAAHVGHTFLTITQGNRNDRVLQTVTSIGSAVLLGGGSTFLSLSFLSMSKAYTFQSFFKIFLLVILFGLFIGLIFLPVVLSLVGPTGYVNREKSDVPEAVELNAKDCKEKQLEDS